MMRLYRIQDGTATKYVSEREGTWRTVEGDIFGAFTEGAEISSEGLKFLAPVMPSKIVCVGLNYRDHAIEQGKPLPPEPLLFIKPSTSVIGPDATIAVPTWAGSIHHEGELGIVIGKRAVNVPLGKAQDYILGLTCVNDVTALSLIHI